MLATMCRTRTRLKYKSSFIFSIFNVSIGSFLPSQTFSLFAYKFVFKKIVILFIIVNSLYRFCCLFLMRNIYKTVKEKNFNN